MNLLQKHPTHVTAELWQGLFFDPSQDVRRLARGIVDDARKTIMSRIIAADSELERAVTLDDRLRLCIHLTELHWELVYQKLVPRDEYNQAIDTVTKYAHDALSLNQKEAAMWYLLGRSEEQTSELQSLMRISYVV